MEHGIGKGPREGGLHSRGSTPKERHQGGPHGRQLPLRPRARMSLSKGGARLRVLAAALTFSIGGAGIKACQLTSWQVASFRSGIAAITLLLLLPEARRRWSWRAGLVGIAYAACVTLFVLANKLTTCQHDLHPVDGAALYPALVALAAPR